MCVCRVLYNNVISVFWNAFLSTLSHAPTIEPTNMMDFFNQQVDHLPAPLHERAAEFAESLYRGSRPLHEQAALFGENMRLPENLRPMVSPTFPADLDGRCWHDCHRRCLLLHC